MKQRGIIFLLITVLSIVGYGAFVFAAPLLGSGGFTPGETLNPDCEPGDAGYDCKVKSGWLLGGNSGTDGGVDDFIGTVDAQDFVIKTDNVQVAKFGQNGNVSMGTDGSGTIYSGLLTFPQALGLGSMAFGFNSTSSGVGSIAFAGNGNAAPNEAQGDFSFSQGVGNIAYSFGEFVIGTKASVYTPVGGATNENDFDRRFVIGNSSNNAYTLWKDGSFAYNDDNFQNDNPGTDQNMFYFNYGNHDGLGATQSKRAIRLGSAKNNEWDINDVLVGDMSIAIGFADVMYGGPKASGYRSIALGNYSQAVGTGAIAIGSSAQATGDFSFAWDGLASGASAISFNGYATGAGSLSFRGMASGYSATAFPYGQASGDFSYGFAYGTDAVSSYEVVFGLNGTAYTPLGTTNANMFPADRLFSIGNGDGDDSDSTSMGAWDNRSDAFTILKNGKTGIGYDNFETTNSNALLQVNGGILSSSLTSCDLLETDSDGLFGCGSFPTNPITIQNTSSIFSTGLTGTGSGSDAIHAIFMGVGAGQAVTNGDYSIFLGYLAGGEAIGSHRGVFIGEGAGYRSTDAYDSIFIGADTGRYDAGSGYGSPKANDSIFIGRGAGFNLTDAALDNSSGGTSIVIGRYGSTGGYSNSIALGTGALNTATNQFMIGSSSISPIDETRINGSASTQCTITTGTGIACTSDERVKTNIEDLPTDILDQLSNIRTVTYNWLGNPSGKQQIGFLAQNLEQVFPQLVETDHEGMKSVYYAQMTPILIEAVKELNLKISDIENFASAENKTLLNNLIAWLGDALNGLTKVHVDQELCIGEICINESDLQQFKDWQSGISGGFGYGYGGN